MKNLTRKAHRLLIFVRNAALAPIACLAVALGGTAQAGSDFPSKKPISLIVPYPAGGASDFSARIFSDEISKAIGQTVIVENIGGASGVIAANRLLKQPADGYQIFHGSPNELILPALVNKSVRFKPEDFELVQPITTATIVILARAGLNVKSIDDLIRLAKTHDGKAITYATTGVGSLYHLIGERMAKEFQLNLLHVPYQGGGPALTDIAGGQVDFAILPFSITMAQQQEQGRFQILTALSNQVPEAIKSIPLSGQSQFIKHFDYRIGGGYFVRKGTPESEKNKLRMAISTALNNPAVRTKLEQEGRLVARPMSADDGKAYWDDEIEKIRELIRLTAFKPM